ncbi:MAG: hypothetical protein JWM05_1140, partial [Acidimicrobiales bacterium]|nr:hypothetical protein [Acidimicrobiales bacterium]
MSPSRFRLRTCLAFVAISAMAAPVLGSASASADPVVDKQAEARRVAADLDKLRIRESVLDEAFNQSRLAETAANREVSANQHQLAAARADLAARQRDLHHFLTAAFANGGTGVVDEVLTGDGREVNQRAGYQAVAVANRTHLVDRVARAKDHLDAVGARLAHSRAAAVAARASVARQRADMQSLVTAQEHIASQVQG